MAKLQCNIVKLITIPKRFSIQIQINNASNIARAAFALIPHPPGDIRNLLHQPVKNSSRLFPLMYDEPKADNNW